MNPPTQPTLKDERLKQEELIKLPPRFVPVKLAAQIVGSEKILERMLYATKNGDPWFKVAAGSGKKVKVSLIDYQSLMAACDRLLTEQPPYLPKENKPDYQREYYLTRTKIKRQQKKFDQHHQGEEVAA